MSKPSHLRFPLLASFVRGYLHQDMPEEYGSVSAALRTFMADMPAKERDHFKHEMEIVAREKAAMIESNALLAELGSSWQFHSEQEVQAFLSAAAK